MGKGRTAFGSGMRGNEQANDHRLAKTADPEGEGTKPLMNLAHKSGMRGDEQLQGETGETAQGLQPGTNLEALAQGKEPPVIQQGDYFMVPVHKSKFQGPPPHGGA
jgi:hypothetical protein